MKTTLMEQYPDCFAFDHQTKKVFYSASELKDYLLERSVEELGNPASGVLLLPVPNFTGNSVMEVTHPEFLCLCPKTGLPDIATFKIHYLPAKHIMELKSFKLISTLFRNIGIFHENVTEFWLGLIAEEIGVKEVHVEGVFNARGGIGTTVHAHWAAEGQTGQIEAITRRTLRAA